MSFKLLAIRPLEGTDPSLLKGLKPNCIYRFYNEYDYLYEYDENTEDGKSFIDYQDQYFKEASNKEDDYLKLEKKEIKVIKYNEQVPDGFFSENINVSAVVGENGSGKSSLLELFYFVISSLEDNNKDFYVSYPTVLLDVFLQEDDIVYRLYFNNRRVIKNNEKINELSNIRELYKFVFTENVFVTNRLPYLSKDFLKRFYFHILNYSLYGLNSIDNEWLNKVFDLGRNAKKITINPNRVRGIIDINIEELLAYKRLLFYIYGFNEKRLLDNVHVENHEIVIDAVKNCGFSEEERSKLGTTETKIIKSLYDILMYQNKFTGKVLNRDTFTKYISYSKERIFKDEMRLLVSNFIVFLSGNKLKKEDVLDIIVHDIIKLINYNNLLFLDAWPNSIYSLNFVFSFKEFVVLLLNYEPLRKYRFLLSVDKPQFQNSVQSILKKDVRIVQLERGEERRRVIKKHLNSILYELTPTDEFYMLKLLIDFYYREAINQLNDKEIFELNIFEIEGDKEYISEAKLIKELLKYYDGEFLKDCFQKCLEDINKDTTINTFELKQAISYFYSNILDDVKILESKHSDGIFNVSLDEKYFTNISNIEDIPIALFTYKINVSKEYIINEKKIVNVFEFNKLSSGELQNINSILLVIYDVYQHVVSLKNTGQDEIFINLIYDEIEMHLHPDYQRKYLKNILINLKQLSENSNFKKHNVNCKFNLLLSTHSPFILSDIPSQNVLKLKEGKPVAGDNINSFGANIHDLLADEFFLDKGFMGEFAKEKINGIIKFLYLKKSVNELNSNMSNTFFSETMQETFKEAKEKLSKELDGLEVKYSKEEVEQHIKLIGEPLLAVKIKEMYEIAFKEN